MQSRYCGVVNRTGGTDVNDDLDQSCRTFLLLLLSILTLSKESLSFQL